MIGYKMGFSSTKVYIVAKTYQVENFKHEWKNDMVASMTTFFAGRVLGRSKFLKQPRILEQKTWPPKNSNLR